MKKITKFAFCGLLATLGLATATSCANNGTAKEVLDKVLITQDGGKVSADFTVPKTVVHNSNKYEVSWTSSDTSVLDFIDKSESQYTADVKRPFGDETANVEVTFTATVSADGGKASTSYKTTIEAITANAAMDAAVKSIGIANAYNKDKVTKPVEITLPSKSNEYKDEITLTYSLATYTTVKLEGDKLTIDPSSGAEEKVELKVNAVSGSNSKEITVAITVNGPVDITKKCTIADGKVTIPYDAITANGKYSISLGKNTNVIVEWTGYVDKSKYKEVGISKSNHVSLTVDGDAYVLYSLISDVYGSYDNMKTYQGTDAKGTEIKGVSGKGPQGTAYTYTLKDAKNVYYDNPSTFEVDLYSLSFTYGEKGKAPAPEGPAPVLPVDKTVEGTTITFENLGYTNNDLVGKVVFTNGTLVFDAGTNEKNAPKWYDSGKAIRTYGGNTLTIKSEKKIAKIEFTLGTSSDGKAKAFAADTLNLSVGTMDYATSTWTGDANEIVLSYSQTSGHFRYVEIVVTYAE